MNEFIVDEKSQREDTLIRFDAADLLYALHDATLLVKGRKDENNILSTTLNNLGVASSEYGVIKVYDVKIKFETKEGEF